MISRLNEILFFYFFSNSFCFNFFSGKYWKRNVLPGFRKMLKTMQHVKIQQLHGATRNAHAFYD